METNSTEEEKTSMKKHRNSNDEQSPSNTDINDPENLDYDEDHLSDQPKHLENNPQLAPIVASDEGELDEVDLEDGEIHDPTASKRKSIDEEQETTATEKSHCRYFLQGRCHWGSNCKYLHPTNETNKSLSLIVENCSTNKTDSSPPNSAGLSIPPTPPNNWISSSANSHFFPNPMIRGPAPISVMPIGSATGAESAWERGLRSAKTLREQSMRRKQQDKDFNEKKFNLSLRDAMDEKDVDDSQTNVDPKSTIDYDLNDRYHSYSRYSNRRSDPREDFVDHRHYRKDVPSSKTKSRKDENPSYRRNSSHSQYQTGSHEETTRSTSHHNRRADDWHDPWERSKTHDNRRSSRTGRERSYTSSSRSSSSSSRSSRSRSRSSSSSSRSRSRSRNRLKRRSSSVTRVSTGKTSNETVKNGNEKKTNGNKKVSSPPTTTTKFLPGRQISSHTLKKAAKSSNNNHSSNHSHSNETRGKDLEKKSKKKLKKNVDRSDSSSSSSSSSESDDQRKKRRSPSSSSSDSSTSENESRKGKETKTKKISGVTKKKRRDTSSSTGSTSLAKKSKLIVDSHPSSSIEPTNVESSDSNKKKR